MADLEGENRALKQQNRALETRVADAEHTMMNISFATLGSQSLKSLVYFPKLPPEMRQINWTMALPGPRVIRIYKSTKGKDRYYSTAKVPALLSVCRESRDIAK